MIAKGVAKQNLPATKHIGHGSEPRQLLQNFPGVTQT